MMTKTKRLLIYTAATAALAAAALFAQDITQTIIGTRGQPALAVVDFRGTGAAQPLMSVFNSTLNADLQASALFDLRPKSMFPANNPQQAADLTRPEKPGDGFALQDWSGPPVNASHLVFGYGAVVNGVFVAYGNLYDVRQATPDAAKLLYQAYPENPDEAGATRAAHKFAADIIQRFGGAGTLLNSRIYFIHSTPGNSRSEIWVMDWDGKNQKQLTHLGAQIAYPTISSDGSRLAFTYWPATGDPRPRIGMVTSDTGRMIPFYNQTASLNAAATFTPDGKRVFYSCSATGEAEIYTAGVDGGGLTRITFTRGNPTEPKVNPKNPDLLLFVQGFPNEQIYRMNAEGAGIERVTNGEGEASNPSWSPDGQNFAFAWTKGYAAGAFNIFVANIASPDRFTQLTSAAGKNENPVWGPDAKHIVFMRTPARSSTAQIYTMLADGTQVTQLTKEGNNRYPVWGVK
jgi:TolB protein